MEENHKKLRNEKWTKLIASDWFSMFLEYLNLYETMQLDTSFCNHKDRPIWLKLLKISAPRVILSYFTSQRFTEWLVLKGVHPREITIFDRENNISSRTLSTLCQISPNLKSLVVDVNAKNNCLLQCFAINCQNIESLTLYNFYKLDLELLSMTLHHLEDIELQYCKKYKGLDKIVAVNRNLKRIRVIGDPNPIIDGSLLLELGNNCPLLEDCKIQDIFEVEISDIEIFTKGCPRLKYLTLDLMRKVAQCTLICNELLQCLGSYNPLLEELEIRGAFTIKLSVPDILLHTLLKHLLTECPLLRSLKLAYFRLSNECITTIANYALNLESLRISSNYHHYENDPIITKENNKLAKLQDLDLTYNSNLNDENLVNLVRGCDKLREIDICSLKITNISLFGIAENCPHLECITLPGPCDGEKITEEGLLELLNKCQKLIRISISNKKYLPIIVQEILNKRHKELYGY